jgi:hypothetical protein
MRTTFFFARLQAMTGMTISQEREFSLIERDVARDEAQAACGESATLWLSNVRRYFDMAQDAALACPTEDNSFDMAFVSSAFSRAFKNSPRIGVPYTGGKVLVKNES